MHELSLMEVVRDQALAAAMAEGATRITAIRLRVGQQSGVEPQALRFAFPVVMAGTMAAAAELCLETELAECLCRPCGICFPAPHGCCDCPHCGTISVDWIRGRDLRLLALEVE